MTKTANLYQAADEIKKRIGSFVPKLAIVLGSGLSALADELSHTIVIPYSALPGFPNSHVKGHSNRLVLGQLNGFPVACLQGRSHTYETNGYEDVKVYVRTLKLIGCEMFLATNASGSLRLEVGPGSLVVINDHINFQPGNPLLGPNDDEFGPRFLPMDAVYDAKMRAQFAASGEELGIHLHEGVYISVLGPCYETPAEIRAFQILGAEVTGMSTVPEVIVAHHCGLRVAAIATITNYATGITKEKHNHDIVVANAQKASKDLIRLITTFVSKIK